MRILITGGAGYIGYATVKRLQNYADDIESITVYDNLSRKNYSFFTEGKFDNKKVQFIDGDLLDGRTLQKAVDKADKIVHLAAKVKTPFADSEAHSFDQINHWGAAQLASIIENSNSIKRLINLSSLAVYGPSSDPVSPIITPNPKSFYGISKLAGEEQLRRLADHTELITIRSGNVYGYNPTYRIDAVINRFMFQANFIGRISINGSGEQIRSFIHVDKVAYVLHQALQSGLPIGTYDAVEHNMSINSVSKAIQEIYPSLEMIHINHNIEMKDIETNIPCQLFDHITLPNTSLKEELLDFKNAFSF